MRYAGASQEILQIRRWRIQLFELALDDKFVSVIVVFRDVVTVQTAIERLSFGSHLAFGNVHYLSAVVLALMGEYHDWKRLTGLRKRYFHTELESSLTEERNSSVCGFCRTGVYRSHYRVSGKGCFHGGVCFRISNLTDNDNVGVETKSRHNEVLLCDVVGIVLGGTGQRVYHVIDGFTEAVLLDEEQLSCAGLNGVNTLVMGMRERCAFMSVVLPEEVLPATTTETP